MYCEDDFEAILTSQESVSVLLKAVCFLIKWFAFWFIDKIMNLVAGYLLLCFVY